MTLDDALVQRFRSGVDPDAIVDAMVVETPCIQWTGARTRDGYGHLRCRDGWIYAHRLAYLLAYGDIPPGRILRHACDTPACVRPGPGTFWRERTPRMPRTARLVDEGRAGAWSRRTSRN